MPKKEYDWLIGEAPPELGIHSLSKHRVYTEYLHHYLRVLNSRPFIDKCKLTVIDAFAGGGLYKHPSDGSNYPGSPLQLIKAAETAISSINIKREKEGTRTTLELDAEYYFYEKKKCNFEYLEHYLESEDIISKARRKINIIQGEFVQYIDPLIQKLSLKSRNKSHRCLFILDQYGYTDVPLSSLNKIFSNLSNAEVILTFSVDSLINYMANTPQFVSALKTAGLSDLFDIDEMMQHKNESPEWKFFVQTNLLNAIHKGSGAKFYTPFFIKSQESNRSFWLIHLSNHSRARDVMTELHWKLKNQFVHFGDSGLHMFGYDPTNDQSLTKMEDLFSGTEFGFDEVAKEKTLNSLINEIPDCLTNLKQPITFESFYQVVSNYTPATSAIIKQAMEDMISKKQLIVKTEESNYRKKSTSIKNKDLIEFPDQKTFFFNDNSFIKK